MAGFNYLERRLARAFSRFPALKRYAKAIYSRLAYIRHKKSYRSLARFSIRSLEVNKETFFGYYDKSPCNSNGLVLVHEAQFETSNLPAAKIPVVVSLYSNDLKNRVWHEKTLAYNWQQGARLHWLNDEYFVYNDFDLNAGRYVAKMVCVNSLKIVGEFDRPVQDSYGKEYFLSLNYRRLMALRADYGYRSLPGLDYQELKDLSSDGIWRVDYNTGNSRLLVTLEAACRLHSRQEFGEALHKFNHVMISPNGKRFIFIHRFFIGSRRFDRLLMADAHTGELSLLSDYGMVSHCFWADDETVFGYMRGPRGQDGYWLIDLKNINFKAVEHGALARFGDGHPHVVGDWFVTDTYPDKSRMQHLILCNWKTGEVKELGEFFHGFKYSGETRCDLHPRFSPDGKYIFFDSVFTGKRQLYRMELTN